MARKVMPQDVYDFGAVTAAWRGAASNTKPRDFARQMITGNDGVDIGYSLENGSLVDEISKSADLIYGLMRQDYSKEEVVQGLELLAGTIKKFHPDGRKRNRLFQGAIFAKPGPPASEKAANFKSRMVAYRSLMRAAGHK